MGKIKWFFQRLRIMSLHEILLYRIPQQFQRKVLGRIQATFQPKGLQKNTRFQPVTYLPENLQRLFNTVSFTSYFPVFDTEIDIEDWDLWRGDPKKQKTIAYKILR